MGRALERVPQKPPPFTTSSPEKTAVPSPSAGPRERVLEDWPPMITSSRRSHLSKSAWVPRGTTVTLLSATCVPRAAPSLALLPALTRACQVQFVPAQGMVDVCELVRACVRACECVCMPLKEKRSGTASSRGKRMKGTENFTQ